MGGGGAANGDGNGEHQDEGGRAVIVPAFSNPDCGAPSQGSLCAGASTVILVQADNVTIAGLTVDGHNPHLAGGLVRGGVAVHARNGIITNHNLGVFTNIAVHDTTVRNIYLRGIQIDNAVFDIRRNRVSNVQGENDASVAIFGRVGSGVIANNTVSDTPDALNANHSSGTRFLDNTITRAGSGVHTDNAGDGGGAADLISGNSVRDCTPGGFGVWSFVSYIAPHFDHNTVSNCDVGLAAYGVNQPVSPLFTHNSVRGSGAPGAIGALISSNVNIFGFGDFNVAATLTDNTIRYFAIGIQVEQTAGHTASATVSGNTVSDNGAGVDAFGGSAMVTDSCISHNATGVLVRSGGTATTHHNRITHNTSFGENNQTVVAVDATNNWWGSASGPAPAGQGDKISALVNATPFLSSAPALACAGDDD